MTADGATISKEVCDAVDKLGQLIRQVIEALLKSLDVRKKEITDKIEEVKKNEVELRTKEEEEVETT